MDGVTQLASKLGKLIAKEERYERLREAENAIQADPELRKTLDTFERQRERIAQLEAEQKPIEPEEKRELQQLTETVHANPKLQELARAQADYMEMMNSVNTAIRSEMDATPDEPSPAQE